jgi:hypothetical protein
MAQCNTGILNVPQGHAGGTELRFLLSLFNIVFAHEFAPQRNLLADKITQHLWVACHNLNAK